MHIKRPDILPDRLKIHERQSVAANAPPNLWSGLLRNAFMLPCPTAMRAVWKALQKTD